MSDISVATVGGGEGGWFESALQQPCPFLLQVRVEEAAPSPA